MKNLTPRQIALIASLSVALIVLGTTMGMRLFVNLQGRILHHILLSGLVFLVCFAVFSFVIQKFIYRKIKLIYKIIYDLKSPSKIQPENIEMSKDILYDTEQEVMHWTKSKKLETDQLKKLEKYRKEFLANVSHELKTPIFNIQGYVETLIDGGIEDRAISLDYLRKASKNVDRMTAIIDDLETISRFESTKLILKKEEFNIFELAEEVLQSFGEQAKTKEISLQFKEGCGDIFIVNADREKIRQVLINLIANSIKYGRKGGETFVGFYDMDERILVEVSDNGIGLEKQHLPRIFERFYRVDTNRSREQGGTGLGLSIVKHIIEAHGQGINVRSTHGVGSTFGFSMEKVG